jgi:hypothetical protein
MYNKGLLSVLLIAFSITVINSCKDVSSKSEGESSNSEQINVPSVTENLGDLTLTCSYKPKMLLAQKGNSTNLDSTDNYLKSKLYMTLSFAVKGKPLEDAFAAYPNGRELAIAYLSNGLASDLFLQSNTDTLRAAGCIYPRQYSQNASSTVLVAFETDSASLSNDFAILYRAQRFGLGTVRFPFSAAAVRAASTPNQRL